MNTLKLDLNRPQDLNDLTTIEIMRKSEKILLIIKYKDIYLLV